MRKPRQTTYEIRCNDHAIAYIDSYYSKELEHSALLHNASRAAAKLGYDCFNILEDQRGVACEMLTVTALDPE